jgi:toluene monooxygenase system protein D
MALVRLTRADKAGARKRREAIGRSFAMARELNGRSGGEQDLAGPVFRGGDIAAAALEAIRQDNPDKEIVVEDHGTYVRIEAEGGLVIRRKTVEEVLGRPVDMQELQGNLSAFSGQIETQDNLMRWYFKSDH